MSDEPRATDGDDAPKASPAAPPAEAGTVEEASPAEQPADAAADAPSSEANAPSSDASAASSEAATTAEGAPKKRRRKKKKAEEASEPEAQVFERPRFDARGLERPAFLLRFPEDPELEPVIAAFEAGNYGLVRKEGQRLSEYGQTPEVRRAADELLRRIDPDPLLKLFLATAIALLLVVVGYGYMGH